MPERTSAHDSAAGAGAPDGGESPAGAGAPDAAESPGRVTAGGAAPEGAGRAVRELADTYVVALADLDPLLSTSLGLRKDEDRLPDLSPAGQQAKDDLARLTLARLDAIERQGPPGDPDERRCARLLRERLEAALAVSDAGEHLRHMSNVFGPPQRVRGTFLLMPAATEDDWAVIARRMGRIPEALAGYRASLEEGARRGLLAAPRQVATLEGQLADWLAAGSGKGWFAEFAAGAQADPPLRADLDRAAASAAEAVAGLRGWLAESYEALAEGTPDGVGADRYLVGARYWTGATLDLDEVYDWGWSQYRALADELEREAGQILPGASPQEAMRYLNEHSPAIEGVEEIRARLQEMLDEAVSALDGTHFDLPGPYLAAHARGDQVPALGPGQHLVSRGRPRPSPAARAVGLPVLPAVDVPDRGRRGERMLRGMGTVRRAADGRARLPVRPRRPPRLPGRPAHARDPGGDRRRHAPGAGRAGRLSGRCRADLDRGAGPGVLRRLRRPRDRPLPERTGPGDQLQAGGAGLAGGPGGGPGKPRAGVRPESLAHGRALAGRARPRRSRRRAGQALAALGQAASRTGPPAPGGSAPWPGAAGSRGRRAGPRRARCRRRLARPPRPPRRRPRAPARRRSRAAVSVPCWPARSARRRRRRRRSPSRWRGGRTSGSPTRCRPLRGSGPRSAAHRAPERSRSIR